jgi:predicted DNA-binding protein
VKRTQIYLPEELHEEVRRLAFEQRRSMADVIREAVAAYMDDNRDGRPSWSDVQVGLSPDDRG